MKNAILLALVLALPLSCTTWYKGNRPESEVPKAEQKRDEAECQNYAILECSKVEYFAFKRCYRIHYYKCVADRGWHKE